MVTAAKRRGPWFLVTGGAGFIGSHLVEALAARGSRVLVIDDLSTGRRANVAEALATGRVDFIEGSVLDARLIERLMRAVDGCFHLASPVGVKLLVERPLDCLLSGVRGTDVVLSSAVRHARPCIFTSSSEIYGRSDEVLAEDCDRTLGPPASARSVYATVKAFGEALACSYARERCSPMVVARLFNVVGPRQVGTYGMVLPRFVRQALAGDDLTVYGTGMQTRCFLHVSDAVAALIALFECGAAVGRACNVGSDVEISIRDLARKVLERCGSRSPIRFVPYEQAYGVGFEEVVRRVPDISSVRQLTGWYPARSS